MMYHVDLDGEMVFEKLNLREERLDILQNPLLGPLLSCSSIAIPAMYARLGAFACLLQVENSSECPAVQVDLETMLTLRYKFLNPLLQEAC